MRLVTWKFALNSAVGAFVLLLLFTPSVHADAASKDRKVREMLALMRMEETTNRMEQAQEVRMRSMSQQQLAGATLDADQKKAYEAFQQKILQLLRATATWKALEPDFVKLYSDAYSEEEIDGILAFYHSPAGRAMLAKTPDLTERSIAISKRRMDAVAPKIQELIDQFIRDAL